MIQKIEIKNFQSHKHTIINLTNNVNVITGTSDCGKSSIIRAIKWCAYNKPRGEGFRSHWGGDTSVMLDFGDIQVTRFRGKENMYILHKDGIDSIFKAVQTDVPKEIESVLKMEGINLQQQLDSPFLLSSSAGEVAQHFNKIANLSQIDIGLKKIKSKLFKITNDKNYVEDTIKEKQNELGKYDYLDSMEKDILLLEATDKERQNLENISNEIESILLSLFKLNKNKVRLESLAALDVLVKDVYMYQKEQKSFKTAKNGIKSILENIRFYTQQEKVKLTIIQQEEQVNEVLNRIKTQKSTKETLQNLENIIISYFQLQKKEQQNKKILLMKDDCDKLEHLYRINKQLNSEYKEMKNLINKIQRRKKEIHTYKVNIKNMKIKFHNNMPDICPLCGK